MNAMHNTASILAVFVITTLTAMAQTGGNLAPAAKATTSFVSGHETITALNDGFEPRHADDKTHGAYGNWPRTGTQWVAFEWPQAISTRQIAVYWFDDGRGVRLPAACRLLYWDGSNYVPVKNAEGLGLERNKFNVTTFEEITTTRLRLEFDGREQSSTGVLEWRVLDSGKSPNFPPTVTAGPDRTVVLGTKTYLDGAAKDEGKPSGQLTTRWVKQAGPGNVTFADPAALATTATFSKLGAYVLELKANDGQLETTAALTVKVEPPFPATPLQSVHTKAYQVNSKFWNPRLKSLIVNWLPHCYNTISDLKLREGGIANFIEAGKKLKGQPSAPHQGPVFANGWVFNTLEPMCLALLVDAQGDAEINKAQQEIRAKIEEWIPILLSAQEPDGYLQTAYTLSGRRRWSNKSDHEGYIMGYFMEAAVAHYVATGGKDTRLYDAAKKMADCWCDNIGPAPKKAWYEGHQELEMALVRLARLVEEVEGKGKGRRYVELAKFLLDSRKNGEEYDQSHLPVTRQYEAVGHAVRAVYSYAGMTDIAVEYRDHDYQSAVKSIWDNLVNKKYYVTGGVGSGETSEGFGKNYSLPNNAYCETCSGCGELFFQHKLNLACQESRHADLYEETLYNAILGGVDLEGKNFTYTNPLDMGHKRYPWHGCPCCVGNFPRVLLSLPTWMYAKDKDSLYVNLFAGSTFTVENVAGTDVQMVQTTEYPWDGAVAITVNPANSKRFNLRIRIPNRQTSEIYRSIPGSDGLGSLKVNGSAVKPKIENGYAVINRTWKKGDRVEFTLPMPVQRVKAIDQVAATRGRVALRYGPLIYNLESVEQNIDQVLPPDAPLTTEWRPDLLGGVMVIKGSFAGGQPLLAIPNYARNNRGERTRSIVWIKDR